MKKSDEAIDLELIVKSMGTQKASFCLGAGAWKCPSLVRCPKISISLRAMHPIEAPTMDILSVHLRGGEMCMTRAVQTHLARSVAVLPVNMTAFSITTAM